MKLGVSIPTSHQGVYLPSPFASAPELTSIVRMAERFGFYSAWVLDLMTPSYERHKQPLEPTRVVRGDAESRLSSRGNREGPARHGDDSAALSPVSRNESRIPVWCCYAAAIANPQRDQR